jgi:hypothetical protein
MGNEIRPILESILSEVKDNTGGFPRSSLLALLCWESMNIRLLPRACSENVMVSVHQWTNES